MLKKIRQYLMYAGSDSVNFERIKNKVQRVNLVMVTVLSTFATILITVMFFSSFKSEGVKQNRNVYLIGIFLSLAILILSATVARKRIWITTFLIYLSYMIYYMYGILIGTITDPDGKTVTFMVLLVFMPLLFVVRPIRIIFVTCVYVTIFITLCLCYKKGAVLSVDVIDAVIFGILGAASGCVINQMKIRGYVFEQKLQEISRIDQLTRTRNRNAFEVESESIPEMCKHSLACLYVDVNGLHEVNNEKGHEFGDKMLKYIASEIKHTFTEELVYRVGGDEFVVFVPDEEEEKIKNKINELNNNIEKEGYHIAIGYEIEKVKHISIDNLIKSAEVKMFYDKNQYYKNIANREVRNKK